MRHHIPVATIMTKVLITLTLSDDLQKAEKLFEKHKIRHIPIVSNETLLGILSFTDLMRISYAELSEDDSDTVDSLVFNMFSIEQVMIKDVFTVNSKTSIKQVAAILAEKEFHALPVVDNDKLVGIVTTTDVLKYFAEL